MLSHLLEEGANIPDSSCDDTKDDRVVFIEQFAEGIIDYTSRYTRFNSILYSPDNLIGKTSRYPNSGDDPYTYMLRSYGKWWQEWESAQQHYMMNDREHNWGEDYVTIRFAYPVMPHSMGVYETMNPGAITKIWGRRTGENWHLLFDGAAHKHTNSKSRKYAPPLRHLDFFINEVRLEINQSKLDYHTALDAVLLSGYRVKSDILANITLSYKGGLLRSKKTSLKRPINSCTNSENGHHFLELPDELVVKIFSYCSLYTLNNLSLTCKRFNRLSKDVSLFRNLSLKRYWPFVNDTVLSYFAAKCDNFKKLDLSWCGHNKKLITVEFFCEFLETTCQELTHLAVNYSKFLRADSLLSISKLPVLKELRLRGLKLDDAALFLPLANLTSLICLDVSMTKITLNQLAPILKANNKLQHLVFDFCDYIVRLDDLAEIVATHNRDLITWCAWQTTSLSSVGVERLAKCRRLRDLDLGWSLTQNESAACLSVLAGNCPDLRRVVLAGWRAISNHTFLPILRACKNIEQLDLTGVKNITADVGDIMFRSLPRLRMVDISFCEGIKKEHVVRWHQLYPEVVIYRTNEPAGEDRF